VAVDNICAITPLAGSSSSSSRPDNRHDATPQAKPYALHTAVPRLTARSLQETRPQLVTSSVLPSASDQACVGSCVDKQRLISGLTDTTQANHGTLLGAQQLKLSGELDRVRVEGGQLLVNQQQLSAVHSGTGVTRQPELNCTLTSLVCLVAWMWCDMCSGEDGAL
jgi:hypothetical protein